MPSNTISIDIRARSEAIFDVVHNYNLRLEWDPFLREARLLDGAKQAATGVSSRCVARWGAGGAAMETRYVTFSRPDVTAVRMTRGPWFLQSFAASIRHTQITDDTVRVTYCYNFRARMLAVFIEPIVGWMLRRETTQRLGALKRWCETA